MAGIGFELKKILQEHTLTSVVKTFGYSAILSSGPWVISMIIILGIGLTNLYLSNVPDPHDTLLKSSVTYVSALAISSVLTGFLQLPFTRFVADRIYEKRYYLILPNFFGTLMVTIVAAFIIALPLAFFLFETQSNLFILLYTALFVVLSCVWIANILAASLKLYRYIFLFYTIGYGTIYFIAVWLRDYGVLGFLIAFVVGNSLLFMLLFLGIVYHYPSHNPENQRFIRFDMYQERYGKFYWKLAWSGIAYNLAIWVDKIIFWYSPLVGYAVIDRLHASMVYDFPIFLAYLSIIPGMAIFFFRLEADFATAYERFYNALSNYGTLSQMIYYKNKMIKAVTRSVKEVLFVQGMFNILLFLSADNLFDLLQIPKLYMPLFYVDVIGVQLQLGFMSILAFLYYLDRQKDALSYTLLFVLLNGILTWISVQLGPYFYGYGFSVTLLILFVSGIYTLNKILQELDYQTFMLQ